MLLSRCAGKRWALCRVYCVDAHTLYRELGNESSRQLILSAGCGALSHFLFGKSGDDGTGGMCQVCMNHMMSHGIIVIIILVT